MKPTSAAGAGRSAGGTGEKRAAATDAARVVLAQKLAVRVEQVTQRFFEESRDLVQPGEESAKAVAKTVSRHVTSMTLKGSQPVALYWDCVTGEMNALVSLEPEAVALEIERAARAEAERAFLPGKTEEGARELARAAREALGDQR